MTSTNWTAITTFEDLLLEANRTTPFWTAMLYMIWIVLMITFLPFGITPAILSSSFLAIVLGLFLSYAGLMPFKWLLTFIGVIIATIIYEALFAKKES